MAIAEFPMVSTSGSNPPTLYFQLEPEEFVVSRTVFDDGGADYKLQSGGTGVKRWILKYDGLTAAQAAILDAHVASAFYSEDMGSAIGFNFRDRDTAVLYSNVHYAPGGYKKGHTKTWVCSREVILEKRP
jgi:hypothetical protein